MAHILVVDDDEPFRHMLRRTLERVGHAITEAVDGGAALRILGAAADTPVDLVITDLIMPGMEGIETIRALRSGYPRVQVIAMSGGGRMRPEGYLEVARAFGAARILIKPFDNAELFTAINAALGL